MQEDAAQKCLRQQAQRAARQAAEPQQLDSASGEATEATSEDRGEEAAEQEQNSHIAADSPALQHGLGTSGAAALEKGMDSGAVTPPDGQEIAAGDLPQGLGDSDDDLAAQLAGTLPVYRIPGLALQLPTSAGDVDFTPLFLSRKQLDITWVRLFASCPFDLSRHNGQYRQARSMHAGHRQTACHLLVIIPYGLVCSQGMSAVPFSARMTPDQLQYKQAKHAVLPCLRAERDPGRARALAAGAAGAASGATCASSSSCSARAWQVPSAYLSSWTPHPTSGKGAC